MNNDAFQERLQEHFDQRVDPLDDEQVVAFLNEHPEWLPRLAALRADVRTLAARPIGARPTGALPTGALPTGALPTRTRRRWFARAAGGAAAVAAVLLVWIATATPRAPRSAGRIVAASLTELRPRSHLAANFVVSERLLTTATTRLETYTHRSEAR